MNLRKEARGRDCQVRLNDVCNGNPDTVVLAHVRLNGVSGMGHKAPDLLGAWACSTCHLYVDAVHDDKTAAAFAEGVYRTIYILWKEGKVQCQTP
jgi:hypothetical protein